MNQLSTIDTTVPEQFTVAGVAIRQDAHDRFCLNDIHKAAGNEKRHGPSYWNDAQQTQDLIAEIEQTTGIPAVSTQEGRNGGTYVCKELVYAYAMWVNPSFHLKVIRAYDELVQGNRTVPPAPASNKVAQGLESLEVLARFLNVAPSGRITMARAYLTQASPDLLPALPAYAVDAPTGSTEGSSKPTAAATALLKEHCAPIGTATFNKLLESEGYLETRTRKSTSGATKSYKAVTAKGMKYGKNITSPNNPRETQPHWYVASFGELLDIVCSWTS